MYISASSPASVAQFGLNGAVIATGTGIYTGPFYAIKAISTCVVSGIVCEGSVSGSINGLTIAATDLIPLYRMTSVQLKSGEAILYKA